MGDILKVLWPSQNVWTLWTNPETISKNWIVTPCLACLPVWLFGVHFAFIKLKCCCWQLTSAKLRHNSSGPQCEIFLTTGSYHLERASNVKIGVECWLFVIAIFFNCGQVLQFGAYSRYYKGALTQKRSFLVICTTFRSDFHVGW